jgi:hypothetical protein
LIISQCLHFCFSHLRFEFIKMSDIDEEDDDSVVESLEKPSTMTNELYVFLLVVVAAKCVVAFCTLIATLITNS